MTSRTPRTCPICASTNTIVVGPILHAQPTMVAGVALELGDITYSLSACRKCEFQWKDPPIDPELLLNCYRKAKSDNWGIEPNPWQRKFDVLRAVVEAHAAGPRVLDVGCFNGALLSSLGDRWDKFGIEPSRAAAALAESRNVRILGSTLEEIEAVSDRFDVVLAIDVVEHIIDPLTFFRQASNMLARNGIFIVMTGDTRSLAWRWQGSAYWYCSLPEHVSFYSKSSLDRLGNTLGLTRVEYRHLRPRRFARSRVLRDGIKNVAYAAGRALRGFGIPTLRRLFLERHGPSVQTAKDHLIYICRKTT